MRLIDVRLDGRPIVEVTDPEPESYVILSHTWGDTVDEVTFQDYQDISKARIKPGYEKIRRTCDIAVQQGLQYAWIDTCCIDKTSSAELSEAINSMFKWYQDSAFCIAYLKELPTDAALDEELGSCTWFTRGWTLQELIAPRVLKFYDEAWHLRGSRSTSASLLADITGIDVDILHDSENLHRVPIARRMSWAANRNTKRLEDQAYCLLGIFDINMPMIYGEGAKAFLRLQEEIAKNSGDLSLFAWLRQDEQEYRGIFAKSPKEFSEARHLKYRIKDVCVEKELMVNNRGVKIMTTLVNVYKDSMDLVLPLGVSTRNNWPLDKSDGWMGIYLTKTANGYVRHHPHRFYTALGDRCIDGPPSVTVRKAVSPAESTMLETSIFTKSIHFPDNSLYKLIRATPDHLWDFKRRHFLHQGRGINLYIIIDLYPFGRRAPGIRGIIACSTMSDPPKCGFRLESDPSWPYLEDHVNTRTEVTDYIAADFLPRFFNAQSLQGSVTRKIPDPAEKSVASVTVSIRNLVTKRGPSYSLDMSVDYGGAITTAGTKPKAYSLLPRQFR